MKGILKKLNHPEIKLFSGYIILAGIATFVDLGLLYFLTTFIYFILCCAWECCIAFYCPRLFAFYIFALEFVEFESMNVELVIVESVTLLFCVIVEFITVELSVKEFVTVEFVILLSVTVLFVIIELFTLLF